MLDLVKQSIGDILLQAIFFAGLGGLLIVLFSEVLLKSSKFVEIFLSWEDQE